MSTSTVLQKKAAGSAHVALQGRENYQVTAGSILVWALVGAAAALMANSMGLSGTLSESTIKLLSFMGVVLCASTAAFILSFRRTMAWQTMLSCTSVSLFAVAFLATLII